jgi:hypothetical protein
MTVTSRHSKAYSELLAIPRDVRIRAGILEQGGATHDEASGLTVAALAEIHEFGLGVPERSFIRAWFDAKQPEIWAVIQAAFAPGVAPAIAAGRAAIRIETLIKNWINEKVNLPALAPATIARKGSDVPLVDTGVLRSAISAHATVGVK